MNHKIFGYADDIALLGSNMADIKRLDEVLY